ncbi:putative beta-glucosidase A [Yarrowia sp. B02]|nr:putative beta-glucosidase A [Yarrowia sp. B02]
MVHIIPLLTLLSGALAGSYSENSELSFVDSDSNSSDLSDFGISDFDYFNSTNSTFSNSTANFSSPDFYPSPEIGTLDADKRWRNALNQSLALLAELTLPEKVNITTGLGWGGGTCVGNTGGVPRLGIKGLCLQDGPLGIAQTDYVTVFPCGIAMAATFDRTLVRQRGVAIGQEAKAKGVDVHLGPVVGPLGRHAVGGRNWEGFSPDSYLAGKLVAEAIQGVQSENVLATVKHWIGNEQEHYRLQSEWSRFGFNLSASLSSNIGDRAMHETYMWPFADAVRAGVASVMCSYQQINGSSGCQNSETLNGLLKAELGFQGFVVSDWQAQLSGVSNALAGMDMSMPGNDVDGNIFWGPELTKMVANGTLPESRLDDMVLRILTAVIYTGIDDRKPNFSCFTKNTYGNPNPVLLYNIPYNETLVNEHRDTRSAFSSRVALEGAQSAAVLLKNNGILPLQGYEHVGVFGVGSQLGPKGANCGFSQQCSDGALIEGWGSGTATPTEYVSPYEALRQRANEAGGRVSGTAESWNLQLPLLLANSTDVNVIYVLANSGEGGSTVLENMGDRNNVSLWHNGDELIVSLANNSRNNVVVITTVGQVDLEPWITHPNVSAVVLTGPAGAYGAKAMAGVLYGDVNPSGKLPYTIAKSPDDYIPIVEDIPADGAPQVDFDESIYLDYKMFDVLNKTVRYEFGYGLSYSDFAYGNLDLVVSDSIPELLPSPPRPIVVDKPSRKNASLADLTAPKDFKPIRGVVYPWVDVDSKTAGKALPGVSPAVAVLLGLGQDSCSAEGVGGVDSDVDDSDDSDIDDSEIETVGANTTSNITSNLTFNLTSNLTTPYHFANGTGITTNAAGGIGGNPALWKTVATVSHSVNNLGPFSGAVVSQLYIAFPQDDCDSPLVQLRGFDKTRVLEVGELQTTSYDIMWRDLAVWDVEIQSWRVQRGEYQIYVANSSRDFVLQDSFVLQ